MREEQSVGYGGTDYGTPTYSQVQQQPYPPTTTTVFVDPNFNPAVGGGGGGERGDFIFVETTDESPRNATNAFPLLPRDYPAEKLRGHVSQEEHWAYVDAVNETLELEAVVYADHNRKIVVITLFSLLFFVVGLLWLYAIGGLSWGAWGQVFIYGAFLGVGSVTVLVILIHYGHSKKILCQDNVILFANNEANARFSTRYEKKKRKMGEGRVQKNSLIFFIRRVSYKLHAYNVGIWNMPHWRLEIWGGN